MEQRIKPSPHIPPSPECVKEWRHLFSPQILKKAAAFLTMHQYEDFVYSEREAHAIIGEGAAMGRALIRNAPTRCSEDWDTDFFSCSCPAGRSKHERTLCVHEAALLLLWERRHGPWRFVETREEALARIKKEEEELKMKTERERRAALWRKEGKKITDAVSFFPEPPASDTPVYFQVRRAVRDEETTRYAVIRARELLQDGVVSMETPQTGYTDTGRPVLHTRATVCDDVEAYSANVVITYNELRSHQCACRRRLFYNHDVPLCEHELALLTRLQEYINRENPGDATDLNAEHFFGAMDAAQSVPEVPEVPGAETVRTPCVTLQPRITLDMGVAKLSFKVGLNNKSVLLKDFAELSEAAEERRAVDLSKTLRVDFATMDFTPDSLRWLAFIRSKIDDTNFLQEQVQSYSYAIWNIPRLSVSHQEILRGMTLDRFYDAAGGTSCEFVDRNLKKSGFIRVGHTDMKLKLLARRFADANGNFLGIDVSGSMPVPLHGHSESYLLTDHSLSRLSKEEQQALEPFKSVSNRAGEIRFFVGRNKLAEFYYRVVPHLLESPYVDFHDECEKEAESLLPPEPAFLFRIDLDGDCILEELVSYGGEYAPLPRPDGADSGYVDAAQESRVEKVILRYFPHFDEHSRTYRAPDAEERLYRILTEGVAELSRYGEVQGSNAFRRCATRPIPTFNIGVSIESGLLDISILSKDVSPQELLEVFDSYRRKKTFHRLKNGDFVTLSGDEQLASLDAMMNELNISAEEVIRGHIELPLFRALYLDTMLEKHRELASNRDRTYRALLRDFQTIRDADYEVPAAQSDTLRPYQVYGYKWLRTLCAAGFGGILADEMGLGKTLQAITFLQSLKEAGETGVSLIVCPASLVYNWQEEFRRFAPSMHVLPVAGTASVRKAALSDASERPDIDAYITSYDLLRQDIALYERLRFSVMILDEAQYIKNQKAGMTKAVKIVRAKTRLALTGTPIENRLAELWSIFDFLMPGFLYSYPDFLKKFETPIAKNQDPDAAARLKRMTSPFILRRLKTDVLKDLPPKLEEVRYSRFESEQRKLYDAQVVRMKNLIGSAGTSGEERIRIFAELMRIRQICCDPALVFEDYHGGSAKRAACMELVKNAIGGGHRMLIFSQFTSMLALLEDDMQAAHIPYYKIIGSTPKEQRVRLVRAFNEGTTPVFLISLKAGGTGLNLTGADVVIHYDPWWNLAAQNQATDRAHRIGQKNQVTVYRMIIKGSIEEKILAMQEAKKDLADAILSGESESLFTLSNEELLELLDGV